MDRSAPLVAPIPGKSPPKLGPFAILVSSGPDLDDLRRELPLGPPKRLMMSSVWGESADSPRFAVAGPVVSSAYAVMLLEPLIVWGVTRVLFVGWCGALSPRLDTGDLVLATGAIIDEGTSPAYGGRHRGTAFPSPAFTRQVSEKLGRSGLPFQEGLVWTTDAIYRETREKVEQFALRGALAVEMELSALFTAGAAKGIDVAGILVVSDTLHTGRWVPGFRNPAFQSARNTLIPFLRHLCRSL